MSDEAPVDAPVTAAAIASRVRAALDSADLEGFADLLSPDVCWGPPGDPNPPCRNRQQVLNWYRKGREQGRRASVAEVEVHGDALLVEMHLDDGHTRWQVLQVGPTGINDIRGFERRQDALEQFTA